MSAIAIEAVRNQVLKGIDLQVGQGELFVLSGPSGAGKTSLLRVVSGLMAHTGSIFFGRRNVTGLPPHQRRVGYVFQDPLLFPHLSVAGNIRLALRNRRLSKARKAAKVMALLEMLQIESLAQRRPDRLSGGERQRVALARALASSPRILLLDEPFNSLDAHAARYLRQELKRLQRKLGLTTILVTHDREEALTLADRMAVLREGRLVAVGTTAELLGAENSPRAFWGKGITPLAHGFQDQLGREVLTCRP